MTSTGEKVFRPVPGWEQLPANLNHLDGSDVAIDSSDRVYVLGRAVAGVFVYEPSGTFVTMWGAETLSNDPHGLTIGQDDLVYCVDKGLDAVFVFTTDGEPVRTLTANCPVSGHPGRRDDERPFNQPTKAAVTEDGHLYVADGYGNSRIHHFDPGGRLVESWGKPGNGPGQFRLPHSICITPEQRILVADRENERIQIFTSSGGLIDVWPCEQRPAAVSVGPDGLIYVAELGRSIGMRSFVDGAIITEEQYDRISILDRTGQLVQRIGGTEDVSSKEFLFAAHGIAVDSAGSVYVAQVVRSASKARGVDTFSQLPTLTKFGVAQS